LTGKIKTHQRGFDLLGKLLTVAAIGLFANSASAAGDVGIEAICWIVEWLKTVVGAIAVIAIIIMVINSFWSKNSLIADIATVIIIGCIVAYAAGTIVQKTGLTVSC
jgi:hypothetical protein